MGHCCENMEHAISEDIALRYIGKFREYGLPILDGGSSMQEIHYCPWCGDVLPPSLRDSWFDIVYEKYGIEEGDDPRLPTKYKSEVWWQDSE